MNNSFWKAGHAPTLFAAFLYFDLSFMVWYVLGPLGVQIAGDLQLSTQQRAMMVATPILAGAVLRFLLGLLADRWSPKSAGILAQVIVIAALAAAWLLGVNSYAQAPAGVVPRLRRGILRRGPAARIAMVPAATPGQGHGHRRRGNSGTVLAALFAPGLAAAFGWNNVFGFALLPLVLTLLVFAMVARNAPQRPAPKAMGDYLKALGDRDSWWFMFFYSVTFGGFLGLASTLPGYFHDQYGLNPVTAGLLHRRLRLRRQPDAPARWRPRRSHRRHPQPADGVHPGRHLHRRGRFPLAQRDGRPRPVRGRHAQSRCR
ncbi:MFS transporter [Pseudomonas aeruginosa]|nr:MFS transporter [Pseudomonas aeruginosa]